MTSWAQVIPSRVERMRRTLVSTLQEIFEESAYARFLAREGLTASKEAYGKFIREHGEAKARRPKCC